MASHNRTELNGRLFAGLIAHASQLGTDIANSEKGRWIARLDDADAELMTKADVTDVRRLTKTLRAAEIKYDNQVYFVFWGLPEVQNVPEGLQEIDVTPALFLLSALEANVSPVATGLEVKNVFEDLHEGVGEYEGHDLDTLINLYPICQTFISDQNVEFTRSLTRVIGSLVARSYENGPIEMVDATLERASKLFEEGSPYLPFEVVLQGLMSISWRGFYLGLYRCIEQIFPVAALEELVAKTDEKRPIFELSALFEEHLAWRPKEEPALVRLIGGIDPGLVKQFAACFAIQLADHADYTKPIAKRIYALRNSLVHFRPGLKSADDFSGEREDDIIRLMLDLVAMLYNMHGSTFHGDLAK